MAEESLVFKVRRGAPELIPPAAPTPYEWKELSDIDDQEGLRFQIPLIFFYRNAGDSARDPAKVIRAALREALVPFYPLAGRLRETAGRKLVVECTGEGVLFVEADADVSIDQFEGHLQPPIPCLEELIFDVPRSSGILHSPLIHFQVTRLKCGGFILVVRMNHTMMDGEGLTLFLTTITELACKTQLSIKPVWERHLLCARNPPRVTCVHHEFDHIPDTMDTINPPHDMVHKSFFFGPKELFALRQWVPPHLKSSTTFEVLIACLWRCRTIALEPNPEQMVRFICVVNARSVINPPIPKGYYGNVLAYTAIICTAGELSLNPVGYAVELVKKAKAKVTNEYISSTADLLSINGRARVAISHSFQVSSVNRTRLFTLDYGWGLPVYAGTCRRVTSFSSFCISFTNSKGERMRLFPICLPSSAMVRFEKELNSMLNQFPKLRKNSFGPSSL